MIHIRVLDSNYFRNRNTTSGCWITRTFRLQSHCVFTVSPKDKGNPLHCSLLCLPQEKWHSACVAALRKTPGKLTTHLSKVDTTTIEGEEAVLSVEMFSPSEAFWTF